MNHNAPVGGYRKAVMGQVDVYPTLLDQMGLDADWRGMGFSALGQQSPSFAVTSGGRIVANTSATPPALVCLRNKPHNNINETGCSGSLNILPTAGYGGF